MDHNADVVPNRASGYQQDREHPGQFINGMHIDISFPFAAGSIRSTAPDLAKWFGAFFDGRIVSPASVKQMIAPGHPVDGPENYGFGIEIRELDHHRYIGHGGAFPSFTSQVSYFIEDGLMVVVLANTGGVANQLAEKIAAIALNTGRTNSSAN